MQISRRSLAVVVAALSCIACGRSKNPAAPSAPTAPGTTTVTVIVSPTPVPVQVQSIAGSSAVRYLMNIGVTFRDGSGNGARITQLTLTVVNGQAVSKTMAVNLAVPAGGTVQQQIAHSVDGIAGQPPSRLTVAALGVGAQGQSLVVPAVDVPLAVAGPASNAPFGHVVVVVEENRSRDEVIGNPAMPFLNGLASQYASAGEYYANAHPSIGNYFMMTVGNLVTNNDGYSSIVSDDNIVRALLAAGRTWKSYAEDLPAVGYTGGDTGGYARRHNVFALLSDVVGSSSQVRNLVPFSQFFADLGANSLPNYSFIVPNLCNDGHDCPLNVVDSWLQANMGPLIGSSLFQRDGLLIITFDEAADSDQTNGGGHVAWIAVSPKARRGYVSNVLYQHQSTLRLTAEALGLATFPNLAATAPDMREFLVY